MHSKIRRRTHKASINTITSRGIMMIC